MLLLSVAIGISVDCFAFAVAEAVFFFSIGIEGCYIHHLAHRHISCPTKLQVQLSVPDACFESAKCLMLGDVLHRVVESGPALDEIMQRLTRLLDTML